MPDSDCRHFCPITFSPSPTKQKMSIQFNLVKNAGALLSCLLFSMRTGKAQAAFTGIHQSHEQEVANLAMTNLAGQLGHNALLLLMGAIALFGLVFICHISKACLDLKPRQKSTGKPFLLILVVGLGMCFLLGSCTLAQQARIEDSRAAQAAENRICPMNQHIEDPSSTAYRRYPLNSSPNWHGPVFCRRCGQRIYQNR